MVAEIRLHLIDPIEVKVIEVIYGDQLDFSKIVNRKFVALAFREKQWLIHDPVDDLFALAYGERQAAPALQMLGFRSSDALSEWLG